jgi:acetyltransferase-like isoleucine patch superfamily enzyme
VRRVASEVQRRVHRFGALGHGSIVRPPYTIVSPHRIFIGADVIIGPNALLSVVTAHGRQRFQPVLRVGDGSRIGQGFVVGCVSDISIGRRVLISSNVYVGDTIHRYDDPTRPVLDQPLAAGRRVSIGDGAFVGINAVILPGVRVGRNAVVGAGAVVTHDVPAYSVAAGNPARVIKSYDFDARAWRTVGA